jgi:hypothetical protein
MSYPGSLSSGYLRRLEPGRLPTNCSVRIENFVQISSYELTLYCPFLLVLRELFFRLLVYLYRRVYALNVVGQIPSELQNLTYLTYLYAMQILSSIPMMNNYLHVSNSLLLMC